MNKIYESTRDKTITRSASSAILQGLSTEGGLFVLKDLDSVKIDIKDLITKNYYEMAIEILKIFVNDFSLEQIEKCVYQAYQNKFTSELITPLAKLKDASILEIFHGPTSAFKDIGLSLLPQLISTALENSQINEDILILTATSGDTGKAALEGFKDVKRTKIIVFYPNDGVSKIQEVQMKTQLGSNVLVSGVRGNFDDCQTAVKNIFMDQEFSKKMKSFNINLSSANSINIGRLIPQMVYYFTAYAQLVKSGEINVNDLVDFIVPTGNFGNILAGFYCKKIGLPINKLVCAANDNNVLFDFINTGVYNANRDFLKTISPSMDILISSNLERLLYYMSDQDNEYIVSLMDDLKKTGSFKVSEKVLKNIQEHFIAGFATNEETKQTIKDVYESENYLLDPHTAVAYKVLKETTSNFKRIVLATASPYKFCESVYESLNNESLDDEFIIMNKLFEQTNVSIPSNLIGLDNLEILHNDVISVEEIPNYVLNNVGKL